MPEQIVKTKKQNNKGMDIDTVMFIVAVSMFLVSVILDMSLIGLDGKITQAIRYTGYGLIIFKLFRDIYDRETIVKYLICMGILGAGIAFNHNKTMFLYSLIVLAAINMKSELLMKVYLIVQAIMVSGIVLLSQIGIIEDFVSKSAEETRHFLGFNYTTAAPIMFLFMIMSYIYIKKGKLSLFEYVIGMLITLYFYKMTDTTFAFLISIGTLTFFFLGQIFIKQGYITFTFRHVLCLIPWISAAVSIWAQYAYDSQNAIWTSLDELVHSRLKLGHEAIETYGFHLFGRSIEWVGNSYKDLSPKGYNYVDCSYLQIALQQGVLFLLIVLFMYSYVIYKMIKEEKYYGAWIGIFIAIFSMSEPRLVNLVFNPFVALTLTIIVKDISEITNIRKKIKVNCSSKHIAVDERI